MVEFSLAGSIIGHRYFIAVLTEQQQGRHGIGRHTGSQIRIPVQTLTVDQHFRNDVVSLALQLPHHHIIAVDVSAEYQFNIFMLTDQHFPKILSNQIAPVRAFQPLPLCIQVGVGGQNHLVVGMCFDHITCPADLCFTVVIVQCNDQPLGLPYCQGQVGVGQRTACFIPAIDLPVIA